MLKMFFVIATIVCASCATQKTKNEEPVEKEITRRASTAIMPTHKITKKNLIVEFGEPSQIKGTLYKYLGTIDPVDIGTFFDFPNNKIFIDGDVAYTVFQIRNEYVESFWYLYSKPVVKTICVRNCSQ